MSDGDHSTKESMHLIPLLINGDEQHSEKQFDVTSPATGRAIHRCSAATMADAAKAVDAAADAFKIWRKTPPAKKRDIFLRAADVMERRRSELVGYMVDETGSGKNWAEMNIDIAVDFIKDVAGRIATLEGSYPALMDPDSSGIVIKEPYGVVLAIAPW